MGLMRRSTGLLLAFVLLGLALTPSSAQDNAAAAVDFSIEVATDIGPHLVDSDGNSVYLFLDDQQAESTCAADCAETWPPILVDPASVTVAGADQALLGIVAREDGSSQATFGGWPLYRYSLDEAPGATSGHGVDDKWFLVDPIGNPVGGPTSNGSEAAASLEELMAQGQSVYGSHCAQCHGRNGKQTLGGAAVLVGHPIMSEGNRVARQVLYGGQLMPGFGNVLSDSEVAAVVTYVRNSWGNDFGIFTEEEVVAERERFN